MIGITREEIKKAVAGIDYTDALTITGTEDDAREACRVARRYGFRAVVAFPQFLGVLVDGLAGSNVLAQIPVGFPCGGVTTETKCAEAKQGLERGATDLDMVMNIAAFKAGDYARVLDDIGAVREVAKPYGVPFKVIIEVGVHTDEETVRAAQLVVESGADFVKTSTGYAPGRLTMHIVSLIRQTVGEAVKIKASGGVASLEDAVAFMRAGADVVTQRRGVVAQLEALDWPTLED